MTIKGSPLKFYASNYLLKYRVDTFYEKEPQTIEWIKNFDNNKVFYDIGSNIGLYTCYAAKIKNIKVYSFEPSYFNLQILGKNIHVNGLSQKVVVFPLSLNDKTQISNFYLTSPQEGSALASFGSNIGHDGKTIDKNFFYATAGMTLQNVIDTFKLPNPDYIKIDVDGLEHLILRGAKSVISKATSILIEINDSFEEQKKISEEILLEAGFYKKKYEKADLSHQKEFANTHNQLWIKNK